MEELKTNIKPDGTKDPSLRYDGVKLKEIRVPFEGFYETAAAAEAEQLGLYSWTGLDESGVDQEEVDAQLDNLTEDQAEKFWGWYSDSHGYYELEVASTYLHNLVGEIKRNTGVDLEPEYQTLTIDSPREYNFGTDRLFIKVPAAKLMDLYNLVDKQIIAQMVKDQFTSYDGFSSFYSNNWADEEWLKVESWDHNQWCTLLLAICEQYKINYNECLWS